MAESDWEERWRLKSAEPMPPADPWLVRQRNLLPGGVALDLACGRGRNSLWLAANGYRVHAVDSSPTALRLLQKEGGPDADILPVQCDLSRKLPPLPPRLDLILCFYFLERDLFPPLKQKLSPGGLFIARSFCQLQPTQQSDAIIYDRDELRQIFSDWEILVYEEGEVEAKRGGTLAGIVARKPEDFSS